MRACPPWVVAAGGKRVSVVIGCCLTEIHITGPNCLARITQQTGSDVPAMSVDALREAVRF